MLTWSLPRVLERARSRQPPSQAGRVADPPQGMVWQWNQPVRKSMLMPPWTKVLGKAWSMVMLKRRT